MFANLSGSAGGGVKAGTIIAWAGDGSPGENWIECVGANYLRADYPKLFEAIGETWGSGDGVTTFGTPDGRGRALIGAGQGSSLSVRALGQYGGAEAHTLTSGQMPSHSHGYGFSLYSNDGDTGPMGVSTIPRRESFVRNTTNGAGSNQSHNNMQPYAVVKYFIKAS